jgi:hypothetical protein
LFYDYRDTRQLPLEKIDDQCLVGPDIMIAPFVSPDEESRRVCLPGRHRWFDAATGAWFRGPRRIRVRRDAAATPLFVREGAILPLAETPRAGEPLNRIEFHIFADAQTRLPLQTTYTWDDGLSLDYREGAQSALRFSGGFSRRAGLELNAEWLQDGFGGIGARFVVYGPIPGMEVSCGNRRDTLAFRKSSWKFAGQTIPVWRTPWLRLDPPRTDPL